MNGPFVKFFTYLGKIDTGMSSKRTSNREFEFKLTDPIHHQHKCVAKASQICSDLGPGIESIHVGQKPLLQQHMKLLSFN